MSKNVYIVEDMAVARAALISILNENNFTVAGSAANAKKAWEEINALAIDVVIMDINLAGDKDGIWLAKKIRSGNDLPIVFLTAYGDKNTLDQLTPLTPNGYLMKPYNVPTLLATISIALRSFHPKNTKGSKNSTVFIKNKGLQIKLDLNEVRYIKSDGNYIDIYLKSTKYTVREKLQSFLEMLPLKKLVQVHQRYAINTAYIEAVSNNKVMVDTVNIPISKSYKDDFMDIFN